MLSDLGMHEGLHHRKLYLHEAMDIAAAHQAGTVRFGTDPATSVLDPDCKAHEVDNLYVVDSSFFASIGAVNPTLTIIASALRRGPSHRNGSADGGERPGVRVRRRPRAVGPVADGVHPGLPHHPGSAGVSWAFMALVANHRGIKRNDADAMLLSAGRSTWRSPSRWAR